MNDMNFASIQNTFDSLGDYLNHILTRNSILVHNASLDLSTVRQQTSLFLSYNGPDFKRYIFRCVFR